MLSNFFDLRVNITLFISSIAATAISCRYSLALNFDEYETDWRNLGTSLPSDALRKRVSEGNTYDLSSC